ncbi:hypothetical protein MP228_013123 [Amoeboaphelidium protococcarum]|nr:hypothetical protein MP228_013123 [Amoeboaphelidium protococcarum]
MTDLQLQQKQQQSQQGSKKSRIIKLKLQPLNGQVDSHQKDAPQDHHPALDGAQSSYIPIVKRRSLLRESKLTNSINETVSLVDILLMKEPLYLAHSYNQSFSGHDPEEAQLVNGALDAMIKIRRYTDQKSSTQPNANAYSDNQTVNGDRVQSQQQSQQQQSIQSDQFQDGPVLALLKSDSKQDPYDQISLAHILNPLMSAPPSGASVGLSDLEVDQLMSAIISRRHYVMNCKYEFLCKNLMQQIELCNDQLRSLRRFLNVLHNEYNLNAFGELLGTLNRSNAGSNGDGIGASGEMEQDEELRQLCTIAINAGERVYANEMLFVETMRDIRERMMFIFTRKREFMRMLAAISNNALNEQSQDADQNQLQKLNSATSASSN